MLERPLKPVDQLESLESRLTMIHENLQELSRLMEELPSRYVPGLGRRRPPARVVCISAISPSANLKQS